MNKSNNSKNGVANEVAQEQTEQMKNPSLDPKVMEQINGVRARVHETFGKVSLALMMLPRYKHLSIADLQHLVLEPLIRDRIAIAQPMKEEAAQLEALAGIAIWASVSPEVDAKIREQIKSSTFPIRLKAEDWTSGQINWLLDVVAPTSKLATAVIANFKQVIKEGDLRIHPIVTRLVEAEALKKMGAAPIEGEKDAATIN